MTKKPHISQDSCSGYLLNCRCGNIIQTFCCKNLGEVILNRFSNFATFLLTVKNSHKIGLQNIDSVAKQFYATKVGPQLEKVLRNNCVKLFYNKKIYIYCLKEMLKPLFHKVYDRNQVHTGFLAPAAFSGAVFTCAHF